MRSDSRNKIKLFYANDLAKFCKMRFNVVPVIEDVRYYQSLGCKYVRAEKTSDTTTANEIVFEKMNDFRKIVFSKIWEV